MVRAEQLTWNGPTITFVIPWYGVEVPGGAELQCRRNAEELCARGVAAEVFTTTAGGLMSDWTVPAFSAGEDIVNGVRVRRFPVRERNSGIFDQLNLRLMRGERLSLLEETVFVREIIGSDALETAIAAERDRRLFIFIPYMFGTTYWGARTTGNAYMIPCLHDESYAYMRLYRQSIEASHGLIFNSPAEQRLARRLYSLRPEQVLLLGEGVDMDIAGDAQAFREKYNVEGHFVLYAGRRDTTKNTPVLLDYFQRYRLAGGDLQLVCIGGPGEPLPTAMMESGAAVDLGFLPLEDKYNAYAAATVLCQPSLNESFSLVMMEAWSCGTPALAHSGCAVTRDFCELSGGGLHFGAYDEFAGCLDWFQEHPSDARQMGAAGEAYVRRHFTWNAITTRMLAFLRQRGETAWR